MKIILIFCLMLGIIACEPSKINKLPILGEKKLQTKTQAGKQTTDTVYHQIKDFQFINQDSVVISEKNFQGKIYVADFFFASCPSICSIMSTQMKRVYEKFKTNPQVFFLSHTIDPEKDNLQVLKNYALRYKADSQKWHFVTGSKSKIYEIGLQSYMVSVDEQPTAPGGFLHSGAFILVDKQRRIRGVYDGTDKESVDKLILDMEILLQE